MREHRLVIDEDNASLTGHLSVELALSKPEKQATFKYCHGTSDNVHLHDRARLLLEGN